MINDLRGWARLSYQFDHQELKVFSELGPHIDRGQRLTDMSTVASALPLGIKTELSVLGFNSQPLRAVGFNKTPNQNWSLPWNQDRVIAMPGKTSNPNLKNWSRKSGVWHCEPPTEILEKMAFVYIAFDPIDAAAGGIEIADKTHRFGKIKDQDIAEKIKSAAISKPTLMAGEALLISALTLHRSAATMSPISRRALRIDFALR